MVKRVHGVQKDDDESQILPLVPQLICHRNRTTGTGHSRTGGRDQHTVLNQENICPRRQVEGRDVWANSGGLQPENTDPYQIRITVVGDRVNYPGDCGTPAVDFTTVNFLLNSIVSTLNAKFMTIDVKDFYLNTLIACSK